MCEFGIFILGEVGNFCLSRSSRDRIPSTTPGADPPRDAKDSGSARSHSTHLETSSGKDIVRIDVYIEQCVSLVFLFWGKLEIFV